MVRTSVIGLAMFALGLFAGCASTTKPGALGIDRTQLLMVPAAEVNSAAASGYTKLSGAAGDAGKLNNDPVLTGRVKGVAQKLIAQVGSFRAEAASWAWEVNVFDSDQLNAFCAPGGKIGVFSGLIRKLDLSDDELAAVLGHEIAHALREHTREQVSQNRLSNAIVTGIANSGGKYSGVAGAAAGLGSVFLVRLPFSRQMETEADLMGLELMARAGYDPRLATNVWRKMSAREGSSGGVEFFRTHPTNEYRIQQLEAATPKVIALYRGSTDPSPVRLAASVAPAASVGNPSPLEGAQAASGTLMFAPTSTAPAVKASSASPLVNRALKGGQDEYQVRQAAQLNACKSPKASLVAKGPGSETYDVECDGSSNRRYMCQFGNCAPQ